MLVFTRELKAVRPRLRTDSAFNLFENQIMMPIFWCCVLLQCPPCTDDRGGCADSNMQCITGARMCMCIEGYILDKSGQLCIPHTEGGSVTDIDCVNDADCSLIPYSTCNTRLGMLVCTFWSKLSIDIVASTCKDLGIAFSFDLVTLLTCIM